MPRLLLVHFHEAEAASRAATLRAAGHEVRVHATEASAGLRAVRSDPPDAVVIDLRRLPAQGGAVGTWLRRGKATRSVPLVFVEGDAEKTARVRRQLPDAVFTPWRTVRGAVRRALARPPATPVVPETMAGYAGTPLPRKLGIKPGDVVSLVGAPRGFEATLGALPEGARARRGGRSTARVVLHFLRRASSIPSAIEDAERRVLDGGRLWLAWPKQASGASTDVTAAAVRAAGLAAGWVDFKVCAIDATWSGLCFARRGRARGGGGHGRP